MNNYGRKLIYSSERNFTDSNIVDVVGRAMGVHIRNQMDIQRLYDYYVGNHDILGRTKEVRAEICNKIVVNHAAEITNFKVGFTFGEPVQYVYRGKDTISESANNGDDDSIAQLNKLMYRMGKSVRDRELAQWLYISGVGYRFTSYEGSELKTYVCDPRSTFTVHSDDIAHDVLLSVIYSVEETIDRTPKKKFSVYSKDHYWLIEDDKLVESRKISGNPITEYCANPTRQGCFEVVLEIIDALNNIASNRADGIEQLIQSLIWFNNVEIDEKQFSELADRGGIVTKSSPNMPASIQMLTATLDQDQTQTFADDLYQMMLTIAAVPDRKASAGGNTGQALIIGEGWTMAEAAAKSFEQSFCEGEKQFLETVLRTIKTVKTATTVPENFRNLDISDIDIKFTRNKTDNLLTKTQGLQNQLEAGIHPRIAIANCGLYSDPHQVYVESTEYLSKWLNQGGSDNGAAVETKAANAGSNVTNAEDEFNAILSALKSENKEVTAENE